MIVVEACSQYEMRSTEGVNAREECDHEEDMDDFQSLSVSGLCTFLESQSISTKTLDNFSTNMVSGLAMILLDEGDIKELVPIIIGDKAILWNILKKLKLVKTIII